jgi:hypothetical protein
MSICAVCREVMVDKTYKLPECGHEYHLECIMTWWRSPMDYCDRRTFGECPLCRSKPKKVVPWRCLRGRVLFLKRMARKDNAHPLLKKAYKRVKEKVGKHKAAKKEYSQYIKKDDVKKMLEKRKKLCNYRWRTLRMKEKAEMELATFDPIACLLE